MKMSLCQMIAIFCCISIGFMTAAPFVQTVEAHGQAHEYMLPTDVYDHIWCSNCGAENIYYVKQIDVPVTHADGEEHFEVGRITRDKLVTTCPNCPDDIGLCGSGSCDSGGCK